MPSLTRAALLAFKPALSDPIEVPGLEGTVRIRQMNGVQRERFERTLVGDDRTDIRASLLAFTVADDEGNLLFTPADIPAINAMPAPALMHLHDVALDFNKITDEQIEELAGN